MDVNNNAAAAAAKSSTSKDERDDILDNNNEQTDNKPDTNPSTSSSNEQKTIDSNNNKSPVSPYLIKKFSGIYSAGLNRDFQRDLPRLTKIFKVLFSFLIWMLIFFSIWAFTTNQQWVNLIHKLPGAKPIPDASRNIYEVIESRGFQSEQHFITTKDGYIIQLARIINPYISKNGKIKPGMLPPVLLHHGFQCDAKLWLVATDGKLYPNGTYLEFVEGEDITEKSNGNTLAFVLSAKGYDVWLANYRGSVYSANHSSLSTGGCKFWRFTMDEMIDIDFPAQIDYILKQSKHPTMGYIGHSQGNYMMLAMMSMNDHYQAKIRPFIALSPVFYQQGVKSAMKILFPFKNMLRFIPGRFPMPPNLHNLLTAICQNVYFKGICFRIYYQFTGTLEHNMFWERFPAYFSAVMKGASTGNAAHLFQGMTDPDHGQPRRFDHGSEEKNQKHHGQPSPPIYDATKINSSHIALFYTEDDWLNHLDNNHFLKTKLKSKLILDFMAPDPYYNHMDLIWAKDVGKIINDKVLKLLNHYYYKNH